VRQPFGPRTHRVYLALRERIVRGELGPGTRLPAHLELAAEFGVAPMTVRQVLARLEDEGLVSRQPGRGTYVRVPTEPVVLVVDDEPLARAALSDHVDRAGYQTLSAGGPAEGLALLEAHEPVALVLSDVRLPVAPVGAAFIRAIRRRWPGLSVAALTTHPDDLADLHGTAECPVLILPKPFREHQIDEVLRLALTAALVPARPSTG
jgi:GntR family transcriptional regulator